MLIILITLPAQSVRADDEGWSIEVCRISNEIEIDKPVDISVTLKYNGTAPSTKKKFNFTVLVKKDDEVIKKEITKETDVTQPGTEVKLTLKGPKLEEAGKYIITVENSVATLATKQLVLQE
jgi:hypothetical protein